MMIVYRMSLFGYFQTSFVETIRNPKFSFYQLKNTPSDVSHMMWLRGRCQTSADSAVRVYCTVSVRQNLKFSVGGVFECPDFEFELDFDRQSVRHRTVNPDRIRTAYPRINEIFYLGKFFCKFSPFDARINKNCGTYWRSSVHQKRRWCPPVTVSEHHVTTTRLHAPPWTMKHKLCWISYLKATCCVLFFHMLW